ncbi:hypothetical protein ANO11243_026600 [Dothideomycetidae sp. 11243]|nr:hypothetical protein ANO11243_026600 [fungal sp. No.11243]
MATFRSYPTFPQNAPGSQESLGSISTARSVMAASSDTTSQATADTAATSPTSPSKPLHSAHFASKPPPPDLVQSGWRMRTPENQPHASGNRSAATSPMTVSTPLNGHKRMASGQIKYFEPRSPVDASRRPADASGRAVSVGSTGSRVSEVGIGHRGCLVARPILTSHQAATNLKERLTYAMAKVQHGWEHHNIDQVERLAAAAISPRTVISPRSASSRRQQLTSPRSAGFPSRALVDQYPSHDAPYQDHQIRSAPLPISRLERASSDESMSPPPKRQPIHDSVYSHQRQPSHTHSLAPAARLASPPTPPHHRSASQSTTAQPTTPRADRKSATVRTQTQTAQAEQEAMDALLLMGSPSNGGVFPRSSQHSLSSANQSPRRRQHVVPAPPRMALQYRSESGESIASSSAGSSFSSSSHRGHSGAVTAELLRQRAEVLDQIEAET